MVNALLVPYLFRYRMAESGFATAEDIDKAMVLGCAHRMGPLSLADHVGLDTVKRSPTRCMSSSRSPVLPPPLLLRMVEPARQEVGQGFYHSAPRAAHARR